jgi:hypothetical protein
MYFAILEPLLAKQALGTPLARGVGWGKLKAIPREVPNPFHPA